MDLDKVTYLLALADTRNYSRAAEQCHISQPALTRYIKNLEEELNVTLFDRSSFPIRLNRHAQHPLLQLASPHSP